MAGDDTELGPTRPGGPRDDDEAIGPGSSVGSYRLGEPLASGGFGTVYRAEHTVLGRKVALKLLHPELASSREFVLRFQREARAVNTIGHPNIVDIHEFGELPDGRPYFVMEVLEGESLEDRLRSRGAMSVEEALEILAPLCDAVAAAHETEIIHRDIKASNVMLTGDDRACVLLDFGIAKLLGEGAVHLTRTGQTLGTPACMAPEQLTRGDAGPRTDVYALAVLVFTMLAGRPPFDDDDPAVLRHLHLYADRPRLSVPGVTPELTAAVERGMALDPADRPAGASELLAELRDAAAGASDQRPQQGQDVIAVYLECDATDDAQLDDADDLLGAGRAAFEAEGFELMIDTGNAVVLVSPEIDAADARARARAIHADLVAARPPGVHLCVCLHAGHVTFQDGRPRGGEIGRLAAWTPREPTDGLIETEAFERENARST